jgi:esterase/lipase
MKKALKMSGFLLFLLIAVFLMGPKPEFDEIINYEVQLPTELSELENYIYKKETATIGLKPDNQARIIWNDSLSKVKTKYSVVYLHGFSASQGEAMPLHREFSQRYGCNLYLSRLADCGIKTENVYENIQPSDLLESAKEAIEIGKMLGDSLIILAGSTGASYATYLAADDRDIAGLIFYSPNIDLYDPRSDMMLWPWGKNLTKYLLGGEYRTVGHNSERVKYWTNKYHIDGLIAMKYFLKKAMTKSTFEKIHHPLFVGCFYQDESNQDKVVSVSKMREFFNQVKTKENKKVLLEFPKAGSHVICSPLWSKDLENVTLKTFEFAENIMGLSPVKQIKEIYIPVSN